MIKKQKGKKGEMDNDFRLVRCENRSEGRVDEQLL